MISISILVILVMISAGYFQIYNSDKKQDNGQEEINFVYDQPIVGINLTIENYPKVDGSTSTHPLDVLIACKILNVTYRWSYWADDTKRIYANWSEVGKKDIINYINRNIDHNGTHGSYVNLINGSADIILVAREPSEDELILATDQNVELIVCPVALDAFVFIINDENPVNDLSMEEIQNIYTGQITHWKEVGGKNKEISPYQRNRNSGSQELMETLVMKNLKMIDSPEMILSGMMGPINRLDSDEYGIGYSVYFFKEFMAPNENIKLCGVNGVMPNYNNIKTKKYVFTTEVYAAIRKDQNQASEAYMLWEWLQTTEGQYVIKESGYVPVLEGI